MRDFQQQFGRSIQHLGTGRRKLECNMGTMATTAIQYQKTVRNDVCVDASRQRGRKERSTRLPSFTMIDLTLRLHADPCCNLATWLYSTTYWIAKMSWADVVINNAADLTPAHSGRVEFIWKPVKKGRLRPSKLHIECNGNHCLLSDDACTKQACQDRIERQLGTVKAENIALASSFQTRLLDLTTRDL